MRLADVGVVVDMEEGGKELEEGGKELESAPWGSVAAVAWRTRSKRIVT